MMAMRAVPVERGDRSLAVGKVDLWPNEKMKRKEAKAISSLLSVHYLSIDLSLRTEIVPGIPVSELG